MTEKIIEVVKGEDKIITLRFRDENGDPIDMGTVTEVTAKIAAQAGGNVIKTLTGGHIVVTGSPLIGKAVLTLTDADTALLKSVSFGCILIETERGADKKINKLKRSIQVLDPDVC